MSAIDSGSSVADQARLAHALCDPTVYGRSASERVERLETHISYVFLADAYAYKIKKAVDLGFLNFRALEARRFYCDEELRLNGRFAPRLYLDVVPITGSVTHPVLGGDGPAIEYAVKMRRFSQDALLDRLAERGELSAEHIDRLAEKAAEFHRQAARASADDPYGAPSAVHQPAEENFTQIRSAIAEPSSDLDALERWTSEQYRSLEATLRARKRNGFVRECHGDLHLRNVALVDGDVTLFDCIEFDPNLRWIDVMNEIAFLVMDLYDHEQPRLARRCLNRYLEITGDYAGLRVLRFYVVYRALVRAKVHCLRAAQPNLGADAKARLLDQYRAYVALACAETKASAVGLVITHGFSGSGKTTVTQALVESMDAVRVRSDIERKRLQGVAALARTGSRIDAGAYSVDATARTYERLLDLAKLIVDAGYVAVVDATFLQRAERDAFRRYAEARGVPVVILDVVAREATMRARTIGRSQEGGDASEADLRVLEHQQAMHEPLRLDELASVVTCDTDAAPADALPAQMWRRLEEKLRAGA